MSDVILMSDPRVTGIPVDECGEDLVDPRDRLLVDTGRASDESASAHLRRSVAERLHTAVAALPEGLRLLIVEGHRSPSLQRRYFDGYAAELRRENPSRSEDRIRALASRFVSPPEIAPHSAGATVDLTLVTADGRDLDMGCPLNASPEESKGACYTDATGISAEAVAHRAILSAALGQAGLVNYPTEWWHWSYGDRYWAMVTGASAAIYGPVTRA